MSALIAVALALPALASCGSDSAAAGDDDQPSGPTPVVLDYSPTVSDAGALLYLAANPDVDLLAVTLPSTGEADCVPGVRLTRALLTVAGRADVPIGCGAAVPAEGRNEWPAEWRKSANHLTGVVLPGTADEEPHDAEQLLADVLRDADEPVTVVAVGPLTNLALLLADDPEAADLMEQIVTMGGAVDVAGNVEQAPAAEWNYFVDPRAVRDVLASGVDVLMVPLDATDDVPWTAGLVSRIDASTNPVARAEHQIVSSRPSLDGIYLWDELAAVTAIDPSVVAIEERSLTVDDVGALTADEEGSRVRVATATDVEAATDELLRSFNGGEPLVFGELTERESTYFDTLATRMSELNDGLEDMGEPPASATPQELAAMLVEMFWGVLADVESELRSLTPPGSITAEHEHFSAATSEALAVEEQLLEAIARADGDDPWGLFDTALREVDADLPDRLLDTCHGLEQYSLIHGGPELCRLFGQ